MALKEAHVKENPVPARCRPWEMGLQRNTDTDVVIVSVRGNGGGKKAVFRVPYSELKEAVKQLETE